MTVCICTKGKIFFLVQGLSSLMLLPLKEKSFQIFTYILIFSNILLKATCTYMNRNVFMGYTALRIVLLYE